MNLNEYALEIHNINIKNGWDFNLEKDLPEKIALAHSELSEALEEYRNHKPYFYSVLNKPEGLSVELVDCMIRCLHILHETGVDIDEVMRIKLEYNRNRPFRHGDKKC